MAIVSPDFSEAVEMGPIPTGVYKARVTGSELKTSKAGNQYISWKLGIFDAEGEYASYNNRVVFHSTMLTGKGAGMLKDFYKAAAGEALAGEFDTDQLLGSVVEITLQQQIDAQTGQPTNWPNVKAVKAVQ